MYTKGTYYAIRINPGNSMGICTCSGRSTQFDTSRHPVSRWSFLIYKVTPTPLLNSIFTTLIVYPSSRQYFPVLIVKLAMKFALSATLLSLAGLATASIIPRNSCPLADRFGSLTVSSPSGATSYKPGDASSHFFLLAHSHLWIFISSAHQHSRWLHLCY